MRAARKISWATGLALLLAACGGGDAEDEGGGEPAAQAVEVVAQDFAFQPTSIPGSAGDSLAVTVVNEDDVEHTFTIEDADIDVVVAAGASEEVDVTVGDAPLGFVCRFHPSMTGTIGAGQADAGGTDDGGMNDDLDY